MRKWLLVLAMVLLVSLAACGGEEATDSGEEGVAGDPAAGEQVYHQMASPACDTCHSLEAGESLVGPSLNGIGAAAATRVDGMSAEEYLRQAIVEPNAHVAEGLSSNIMPATYGTQLSEQQINDLVAFLLTQ